MPPESPTTSLTLALRPEKYAAVSSVKHETLCRCPPAETRDLYLDQESSFDPFINRTEQQLDRPRSEEHTSELQSLMRISYAVFCLKQHTNNTIPITRLIHNQPTQIYHRKSKI